MVEALTLFGILGLVLLVMAWMEKNNKHDVSYRILGSIGVVIIGIVAISMSGTIAGLTVGGPAAPAPAVADTSVEALAATTVVKPYTTLNVDTHEWSSNSFTSVAGTVRFFDAGVNPSLSNSNARDTITVTSGVGNTTSGKLKSGTPYVVVLDGTSHYDQWYNAQAFPETSMLPYTETTESAISTQTIEFNGVVAFATISDPLDETATSGIINGQSDTSGLLNNSNELMIGADASPANSDEIFYNITNGDGQFYIDLTIAATGANSGLNDPVIAIVNSLTAPFDGNEFTSVTVQKQSGTEMNLPSDVTNYFNDATPIPITIDGKAFMAAGSSAVYRFTFNVNAANMAAGGDQINIYVDDMGRYLGQDILRGTKATVSQEVTIGVRA